MQHPVYGPAQLARLIRGLDGPRLEQPPAGLVAVRQQAPGAQHGREAAEHEVDPGQADHLRALTLGQPDEPGRLAEDREQQRAGGVSAAGHAASHRATYDPTCAAFRAIPACFLSAISRKLWPLLTRRPFARGRRSKAGRV
jgi:hypothetical protein